MTIATGAERAFLDAGAARIAPTLARSGFTYVPGDTAPSSGGPVAVGYFRRGDFEIGLIVRNQRALGCPNYSVGAGFAGHDDLMNTLGAQGNSRLVPGPWPTYVASDGSDVFDALAADLERFLIPVLMRSEEEFRTALAKTIGERLDRLGFPPGNGHSA
jgi:hypothetical protein